MGPMDALGKKIDLSMTPHRFAKMPQLSNLEVEVADVLCGSR